MWLIDIIHKYHYYKMDVNCSHMHAIIYKVIICCQHCSWCQPTLSLDNIHNINIHQHQWDWYMLLILTMIFIISFIIMLKLFCFLFEKGWLNKLLQNLIMITPIPLAFSNFYIRVHLLYYNIISKFALIIENGVIYSC